MMFLSGKWYFFLNKITEYHYLWLYKKKMCGYIVWLLVIWVSFGTIDWVKISELLLHYFKMQMNFNWSYRYTLQLYNLYIDLLYFY
jgi:hypothetical protein